MMQITPSLLLRAYAHGYFPMARSADATELFWIDPPRRGIIPLDGFIISRSLARSIRRGRYEVTLNRDFDQVVAACAAPAPDRPDTWINPEIRRLYAALHEMGHAHSVECWEGEAFAGGLYGVSLGGAFFGESMVTRRRDASKIALAHLVAQLRADGFRLLDTQFQTDHLARMGCIEVDKAAYQTLLSEALTHAPIFGRADRTAILREMIDARP